MVYSKLVFVLLTLVVCDFCGKDFQSINRHLWRCKSKHSENSQRSSSNPNVANGNEDAHQNHSNQDDVIPTAETAVINVENIICACGKVCKGLVGIRSHQRTCKVIKNLDGVSTIQADVIGDNEVTAETIGMQQTHEIPLIKEGIKLPRSDVEWELANSYFMTSLTVAEINRSNLNDCAKNLNDTIYNYFKDTYGTTNNDTDENNKLKDKYKHYSKNQLKKELKALKSFPTVNVEQVKFVARLLRSKIDNSKDEHAHSIDHDFEISRNFWSYVKTYIEKPSRTLATFTKEACETYFKHVFASPESTRLFNFPDWIPKFDAPTFDFDLSPPTFQQVTRVIKKMKAKGSPCPLDKVSIICFKRCPFLRSYITALCAEIFKTGEIPVTWKRAVTILIYKKGATDNPENFRPITLECVCLKIYTTILRDKIGSFLRKNGYIESHIQKGFVEGMSGTFEHIGHLTYTLKEAKKKQRSLTATLIDLRNAFGLIRHDLIMSTLRFHHVPPEVIAMVKHMYTGFHTAVATDTFLTGFMHVGKGVLQGDCLSPLLFNMVINTFIQRIKGKAFEQLGYKFLKYLSPRHWYQFADDAAVITGMESHNQILLNEFSRWCTWTEMSIRIDKCHSFGMAKVNSASKQIQPKLYLNNTLISPLKANESFKYLGKYFDFEMSSDEHKASLLKNLKDMMQSIETFPLHPRNKIKLYMRYVLPKLSWDLTVSDITVTWVKQTLDPVLNGYVRQWLEIPISGTLDILSLTKSKFGIGLVTVSSRYLQCQVTMRTRLKNSRNPDITKIHAETSVGPNLKVDNFNSTQEIIKEVRNDNVEKITKLSTQSLIVKAIWNHTLKNTSSIWQNVLQKLPKNIYSFSLRYLNNTLANGTNLLKWGRSDNSLCPACNNPQTLGHVIGGCKVHLNEKRYNYRHDSILLNILRALDASEGITLYGDLPGYKNPSVITGDEYRPDILLVKGNKLFIIELTVGFETNIESNTKNKERRYRPLITPLLTKYEIEYVNLSMGALGTFGNSCKNFKGTLSKAGLEKTEITYLLSKIVNVCIRTTYYIFCMRNKAWEPTELMTW